MLQWTLMCRLPKQLIPEEAIEIDAFGPGIMENEGYIPALKSGKLDSVKGEPFLMHASIMPTILFRVDMRHLILSSVLTEADNEQR